MGPDVLEWMEEFILNVPLGIGVRCYGVKCGCTNADAVETWFLSSVFMEMGWGKEPTASTDPIPGSFPAEGSFPGELNRKDWQEETSWLTPAQTLS